MNKLIKVELYKAFHNPYCIISLVCGGGLSIWAALETMKEVFPVMELIWTLPDQYRSFKGLSVFYEWMGVVSLGSASSVFFVIWPVLAALPHGWSLWKERKTSMDYQMIIRYGRRKYYLAKYLAVFMSGGVAVTLPLLLNLILEMAFLPAFLPEITAGVSPIRNGILFSKIYYQHPFIFCLLWCSVAFVLGGETASIGMLVSKRSKLQIGVILMPFVIFLGLDMVLNLPSFSGAWEYSVLRMLLAGSGIRTTPIIIMVGIGWLLPLGMLIWLSEKAEY